MSGLEPADIDIEKLVTNRETFNDFVYTSIGEAAKELQKRWDDKNTENIIDELLDSDIPQELKDGFRLVLLRHIITPNYEIRRFLHIAEMVDSFKPLIGEYATDKFVPSNKSKRFLGKITFYKGRDKNGCIKTEKIDLIDFDEAKNKQISKVKTLWGENLVDFHHDLFFKTYKKLGKEDTFNVSSWYHNHGPGADKYYFYLLLLFIRHGLMFENFILEDKYEKEFIKNIFLPAFIKVMQITGKKPLIVALEPTEVEGDKFWLCYPDTDEFFVRYRLSGLFKKLWLKLIHDYRKLHLSFRR